MVLPLVGKTAWPRPCEHGAPQGDTMTDENETETRTIYIDSTDGIPEDLVRPIMALQFCIDHLENGALTQALENVQGRLLAYHNALKELGVEVRVDIVEMGVPGGEAN